MLALCPEDQGEAVSHDGDFILHKETEERTLDEFLCGPRGESVVESGASFPSDAVEQILRAPHNLLVFPEPEFPLKINVERVDSEGERSAGASAVELVVVHLQRPVRVRAGLVRPSELDVTALGFLILGIRDDIRGGGAGRCSEIPPAREADEVFALEHDRILWMGLPVQAEAKPSLPPVIPRVPVWIEAVVALEPLPIHAVLHVPADLSSPACRRHAGLFGAGATGD